VAGKDPLPKPAGPGSPGAGPSGAGPSGAGSPGRGGGPVAAGPLRGPVEGRGPGGAAKPGSVDSAGGGAGGSGAGASGVGSASGASPIAWPRLSSSGIPPRSDPFSGSPGGPRATTSTNRICLRPVSGPPSRTPRPPGWGHPLIMMPRRTPTARAQPGMPPQPPADRAPAPPARLSAEPKSPSRATGRGIRFNEITLRDGSTRRRTDRRGISPGSVQMRHEAAAPARLPDR
jgi:hypothetical protein